MNLQSVKDELVMTPAEIKAARKRLGMNGREFAELFDVTRNTVFRWEMGVRKPTAAAVTFLRRLLQARA